MQTHQTLSAPRNLVYPERQKPYTVNDGFVCSSKGLRSTNTIPEADRNLRLKVQREKIILESLQQPDGIVHPATPDLLEGIPYQIQHIL